MKKAPGPNPAITRRAAMIRIDCPYCGARDHTEFSYGGDASVPRPDIACEDIKAWSDYVFLRDNPRGAHSEFWHHVNGCREWLIVKRDTATHEVAAVLPARGNMP